MHRIGQTIRPWLAILLGSAVALGIFASNQLKAQQARASWNQQDTVGSDENTGQDFTSPENLFQLRYQYKTSPGTGSAKGSIRTVTTDTLYLRSDFTFDLGSPWKVVFRSDLPFVARIRSLRTIRQATTFTVWATPTFKQRSSNKSTSAGLPAAVFVSLRQRVPTTSRVANGR